MKTQVTLFLTLLLFPVFAQLPNTDWQHLDAPQWQANAQEIRLATDGQTALMAYTSIDTDGAVVVRYFDGNQWMPLGYSTLTPEEVSSFDLAVINGVPTLAFVNPDMNNRVEVLEYNNGTWIPLGNVGFSADNAREIDLIDGGGLVTLAYVSAPNGRLSVAQFDGYHWSHLGGLHFTSSSVSGPQLGYAQGALYVAANDMGANAALTVWSFRLGHWLTVGNAGVTPNAPHHFSFLASDNRLMLAYDRGISGLALLAFDGSHWQSIPATLPPATSLTLLEMNATPYLALNNTDLQGHFQLWSLQQGTWSLVQSDPTDLQEPVGGIAGCVVGNKLIFAFNGMNSGQMSSISTGSFEGTTPINGGSNQAGGNGPVITPLIEQTVAQRLEVYPNPSSGAVRIELPEQVTQAQLFIRNVQGQVVATKYLQSTVTSLELDLPAGLYLLELKSEEQSFQTKLLIHNI